MRRLLTTVSVVGVLSIVTAGLAVAQPPPVIPAEQDVPVAERPLAPTEVPAVSRDAVLGAGWATSGDRAWTTSGDVDGFHLFVADAAQGYAWREVATLTEPGLETDRWIGNMCVTGSGDRAVVVYAPRTFTNKGQLFNRGGFTAIVDLNTGEVRKLAVQSSLAYFNPGCGAGETAVLTQGGDEDLGRTRLLEIDAAQPMDAAPADAVSSRIEVPGQLTSPVPTALGVVAADNGALVRVAGDGSRSVVAKTRGVPFAVAADADGGVVYLVRDGAERVAAQRAQLPAPNAGTTRARVTTVASGPLTGVDVTSGKGGRVFVTGDGARAVPTARGAVPASVSLVSAPVGSRVSTEGGLAVTDSRAINDSPLVTDPTSGLPVRVLAKSLRTNTPVEFTAVPTLSAEQQFAAGNPQAPGTSSAPSTTSEPQDTAPGREQSPALPVQTMASPSNNPADFDDRYCAVPRNDPRNQAMQPKPRQVEWAVNQAVTGNLNVSRPANWKNLGMSAYTPQGLFPPIALSGGGRVPSQVFLGVIAQESNMWQAARYVVPGVTGNPLVGNYYGLDIYNDTSADDWSIVWNEADCGYGVTQITDGMRLAGKTKPGETALPYNTQRAAGLDFAANVAGGLRILQDKWNQTRAAGLTVNNGDPAKIENWFMAVWAYNSGFYPQSSSGQYNGAWGVGWLNNPANPVYPANRKAFLDGNSYADAAKPQQWPYPEKVMGWAGYPIEILESPGNFVAGYRAAYWNGDSVSAPANRTRVKPPVNQFCDASNNCVPGGSYTPTDPDVAGSPAGPCAHRNSSGQYDLRCWYNKSSTWKTDCSYSCGNELLRFSPGYAYQEDGTAYAPRCDLSGLPSNALIIDDVPDGTPSIRPNCGRPWTNQGTFSLNFGADANGTRPGKIDTHQIGGGFGGHFWFTHTRTAGDTQGRLRVEGKWTLNRTHNGPMMVMVALPDHGARTTYAKYTIQTAQGERTRIIRQKGDGNRWLPLGAFMFNGTPEVRLDSVTPTGDGSDNVAFDALAFVPIQGTYKEESVEAAAVFDEDTNLDSGTHFPGSPLNTRESLYNWGRQYSIGLVDLLACNGSYNQGCIGNNMRTMASDWFAEVAGAGMDPTNHPDGNSLGTWIGFANPYTDRPSSSTRPASFNDDLRYKIRSKATVSFVADSSGVPIEGSQWVVYENRTANTHLPHFAMDFMNAVQADYGIAKPNLTYRVRDLNLHNGAFTTANPAVDGILPGRAYAYAGKAPTIIGNCVAALYVSGGSIGYRPMLAEEGPNTAMEGWISRMENDPRVPPILAELGEELREMFFDTGPAPGIESSLFNSAAPIWQELNFRACSDGRIRTIENIPVMLRASWMPDQYLYHNGRAIDQSGALRFTASPLMTGDFGKFSNPPDPNENYPLYPNAYGQCGPATDRSANPWDIGATDGPGENPDKGKFCLDPNLPSDEQFSW